MTNLTAAQIADRLDRVDRAVAELASGVDWTPLNQWGRAALNEIVAEFHTARLTEKSGLRRQELEAELARISEAA